MVKIKLVVLVTLLLAGSVWAQDKSYDPLRYSTGTVMVDGKPCKPTGSGGDRYLNSLKNRDVPPPAYTPVKVSEILTKWPQNYPEGKGASKYRLGRKSVWTAAQRKSVTEYESKGVSIEGYLLYIRREGPESCNCESKDFHDFHLWLCDATYPTAKERMRDRSKAIVAEITPRTLKEHPGWSLKAIRRLISARIKVRVSGWITWDEEHPEQLGKERATLWEIHPIHRIEVYSHGKWAKL